MLRMETLWCPARAGINLVRKQVPILAGQRVKIRTLFAHSEEVEVWPLESSQIQGKGRGLRVTREVKRGESILVEEPMSLVFTTLPGEEHTEDHREHRHNGTLQEGRATNQHHRFMDLYSTRALDATLAAQGRNHPRHAMRLASRILSDLHRNPSGGAQSTWGRIRQLCRASLGSDPTPKEWMDDLVAIRDAVSKPPPLGGVGEPLASAVFDQIFTRDWYCSVMGILALNCISLYAPPPKSQDTDPTLQSQLVSSGLNALPVSTLFMTASLFNHSCVPNVAVAYEGNVPGGEGRARYAFVADRDIPKGEEACISYVGLDLPANERVEHLMWSYGFTCTCPRCKGVTVRFDNVPSWAEKSRK